MDFKRVKISTTAPHENADDLRAALGKAGAGKIGDYTFCSYSITGKGRFLPSAHADPHIGEPGRLETVEEEYIEVVCERSQAKEVIKALKQAHPYEEPVVDIIALIEEDQL